MTEDKNIEKNAEQENLEEKIQEIVEVESQEIKSAAPVEAETPAAAEAPAEAASTKQGTAPESEVKAEVEAEVKAEVKSEEQKDGSKDFSDKKKKKWSSKPASRKQQDDSGFIEKVIAINRVTKVTKGGKKMSFSALCVVGDGKGNVGYCLGKAPEVATAIQKSMRVAKKNMMNIAVRKGTISHEIIGRCGGATVLLKPASEGTGVIAAGPVRAICDASGIRNILTKCHRSNNPINIIKATVDGLSRLKPFKEIGEAQSVSA